MKKWIEETWHELAMLFYWVFTYLDVDIKVTRLLLILMIFDTFVGVIKARRFGRKVKFFILYQGLITKMLFLAVPFVLALMAKGLGYDFKYFIDLIMELMLVSEGISIIGSIVSIKTKKEIENYDLITKVFKWVRNFLIQKSIDIFTNITNKKND